MKPIHATHLSALGFRGPNRTETLFSENISDLPSSKHSLLKLVIIRYLT
jgi:hypothetical protein